MRIEISSDMADRFEADYADAQEIAAQNAAYADVLSDDEYDIAAGDAFRDVVAEGLYEQQELTAFYFANSFDDQQAYTDVARMYNIGEAYLDRLADQYESVRTNSDEYVAKLAKLAEKSIRIAPNKEAEIKKLLEQKIAEAEHENGQEILHRMIGEAYKFNFTKSLFDIAARAWPAPLIPKPIVESEVHEEEAVALIEDEMPVDPTLVEPSDAGKQRLYERYGYTPGASTMAAAVLIENEGAILTPLEIGRIVYADSSDFDGMTQEKADKCIHGRILSLLNFNSGCAPTILDKKGYFLQYGTRRFRSETGKQLRKARLIYRVVRVDRLSALPERNFEEKMPIRRWPCYMRNLTFLILNRNRQRPKQILSLLSESSLKRKSSDFSSGLRRW